MSTASLMTSSLMTSLLMEDCSRFLLPKLKMLCRRLFGDVSVIWQDPLLMMTAESVIKPNPTQITSFQRRRVYTWKQQCYHCIKHMLTWLDKCVWSKHSNRWMRRLRPRRRAHRSRTGSGRLRWSQRWTSHCPTTPSTICCDWHTAACNRWGCCNMLHDL